MKNTKENNKFNYSILLILFQLLIGIIFLAIPEYLNESFPYIITLYLTTISIYGIMVYIKKRDKKLLIESILYFTFAIMLLLLFIFTKNPVTIVAIFTIIYCIIRAITTLSKAINIKEKKQKISNFLGMSVLLLFAISCIISLVQGASAVSDYVIIYGAIYLFESLSELFRYFTKKLIVFKVAEKTHAREIISGLLIAMVTASIVLPFIEPGITTFGDAMWYCFALVTTIGFGDMYATTTLGRMISVIVGIYGIVIVALITSIIVNIYEEQKSKKTPEKTDDDQKDL